MLRPLRQWSLGAKLGATLFVVALAVATIVSIAAASHERRALEGELHNRGLDAANYLARLSTDLVLEEDLWGLFKVVRELAVDGGGSEKVAVYAAVVDPAGNVLAHSDPALHPIGEPLDRAAEAERAGATARGTWWTSALASGETIHHFAARVVVDGQHVATARVGLTARQLEAAVSRLMRDTLLMTSALAAIWLLFGLFISRRMTRPLRDLGQAVDRLAEGCLDDPITIRTTEKDEIGRLADRFNVMARRLPLFVREIRDSQERLIRSERLASIGECAGALAHEIRNPLGSLVAAAKMLSARTPQAASYDREELVQIIGDEARRLNRILTDFLTFAKPRPPSLSAQSLNALAQDVVESLRLDELAAGKRLEARLDPELPPCSVDRDQVKQVLWNVLRNALEASPASGCVTISTEAGAGHAAVEIADEGPGIPSDRQGRLFEPFYTTKRGGSGLGLAIAHRIVTAHGGSIEIASGSGDGTRVRIRLPLAAGRGCGEGEAA